MTLSRQTEDKGRRAMNIIKEWGKQRSNDKVGGGNQLYILHIQAQVDCGNTFRCLLTQN
jgi:hypothetical protein